MRVLERLRKVVEEYREITQEKLSKVNEVVEYVGGLVKVGKISKSSISSELDISFSNPFRVKRYLFDYVTINRENKLRLILKDKNEDIVIFPENVAQIGEKIEIYYDKFLVGRYMNDKEILEVVSNISRIVEELIETIEDKVNKMKEAEISTEIKMKVKEAV